MLWSATKSNAPVGSVDCKVTQRDKWCWGSCEILGYHSVQPFTNTTYFPFFPCLLVICRFHMSVEQFPFFNLNFQKEKTFWLLYHILAYIFEWLTAFSLKSISEFWKKRKITNSSTPIYRYTWKRYLKIEAKYMTSVRMYASRFLSIHMPLTPAQIFHAAHYLRRPS